MNDRSKLTERKEGNQIVDDLDEETNDELD